MIPAFPWETTKRAAPWLVLGAMVFWLGFDYYIVRARALNGQKAFEYLSAQVQAQKGGK